MSENQQAPVRSGADRIRMLLATGFGSGYSPFAPGTAGTAAAALLILLLSFTGLRADLTILVLLVLTTVGSLILGSRVEEILGKKDPGAFVLDEFAGYYVAILTLGAAWPGTGELVVAFFLFRLFDVAKPFPAYRVQDLGGGLGIVLDDLVAGVYALLGVIVYRQVLANPPW